MPKHIELYKIYRAPKGGVVEQHALQILLDRRKAITIRSDYAKTIEPTSLGVYASEEKVDGILIPKAIMPPPNWAPIPGVDGPGVYAIKPKATERTRAARVHAAQLRDELKALPKLPGAREFASIIGAPELVVVPTTASKTGLAIASTTFEIHGTELYVFVPIQHREHNGDQSAPSEPDYVPVGCTEVQRSEYFAAVERANAAKKAAEPSQQ